MSETVVIPLSRPVEVHGETLHELAMREPTGRDMVSARGGSQNVDEYDQRLIASCCGVPPSTIFAMPMRDVLQLVRQLNRFLGSEETAAPPPSSNDTTIAPGSGATSST